jgi:Zn-dependent protease with chaperone function
MKNLLTSTLIGLALFGAAAPGHAQLGDFLNRVLPGVGQPSAPGGNNAPAGGGTPAGTPSKSAAMVDGAQGVAPLKGVKVDLPPDRQCNRPQERFNIAEKLVEYGGTEATLRLDRLIKSDYKYSDLTPQDRQMLQYIARTTIWIPVEVESALGTAFDMVSSTTGESLTEAEELRKEDVQKRLNLLLGAVTDFPGSVKLVYDPQLADGAAAKFGGVILLSRRFLEAMAEKPAGADFVLAHELSHVYKRHAIKQMQFTMISTDEGWDLGKKLLARGASGASTNVIQDAFFTMTTLPKLVEFVRGLQLKFGSEQELEADACSVVWLRARDIDPAPAWDEFETAFAVANAAPTTYGTTHPPTAARKANVKAKVGGGARPKPPPGKADKAPGKATPAKKTGSS